MGGVIFMVNGTLMANNSVFKDNTSPSKSAVIYKYITGELTLDNYLLSMNGPNGAIWNYYYDNSIMRLSNTNCTMCADCSFCLFFVVNVGYRLTFYSSKFNLDNRKIHISSTESNFLSRALNNNLINAEEHRIYWKELPFASGKSTS